MSGKPHLRKCEAAYSGELWHCHYRRPDSPGPVGAYWHTYGATWEVAYDKMVQLSHRAVGVHLNEPLAARLDL